MRAGGGGRGDGRAVRVGDHRNVDAHAPAAGQQVALPTAPHHGEAMVLQEPVAGAGRLVAADGADVEGAQRDLVAAVDHVIEQGLVARLHVDRFYDVDIHRVLDHAFGVARGEGDILD